VVAGPLQHTVPCIGFVLHERTLPGTLDANIVKVFLASFIHTEIEILMFSMES
jgi:hypothetical protein